MYITKNENEISYSIWKSIFVVVIFVHYFFLKEEEEKRNLYVFFSLNTRHSIEMNHTFIMNIEDKLKNEMGWIDGTSGRVAG